MMMAPGFAFRSRQVDLTDGLLSDLRHLVDGLDADPSVVLAPLEALRGQLRQTVTSFTGLRLTIGPEHHPVVLSDFVSTRAGLDVRSSLTVPLSSFAMMATDGEITFFAGLAGAFVDLAADLRFALGLSEDALDLDQQLTPLGPFNAVSGLVERSTINRAVGVLIDRGQTPEAALTDLRRRAVATEASLVAAAGDVLASARRPGPDSPQD